MAENMPSATAQRPGDVLTQYGGITVEVLNTDAEGRLILADAIVRACEDNPDYLIETSTLTGAQTVALGARTPGRDGQRRVPRPRRRVSPARSARTAGRCRCPRSSRTTSSRQVADLANVSGSRYRRHAGRRHVSARVRRRRGAVGAHRHRRHRPTTPAARGATPARAAPVCRPARCSRCSRTSQRTANHFRRDKVTCTLFGEIRTSSLTSASLDHLSARGAAQRLRQQLATCRTAGRPPG